MGNSTDKKDGQVAAGAGADYWAKRMIAAKLPKGAVWSVTGILVRLSSDQHRSLFLDACERVLVLHRQEGTAMEEAWRIATESEEYTDEYWQDWRRAHANLFSEKKIEMTLQA